MKTLHVRYTKSFCIIVFICFLLLGFALTAFTGRYWYRRNRDMLAENVNNVADSASQLLSGGYISMFGASEDSIATLCSSLSLISTSINADVFICDTSGYVIMCQDLVGEGTVIQDGYCPYHSELLIGGQILNKATNESYSAVSNLEGQYDGLQYVVSEPVKVLDQAVAIVFAVSPVTSSIVSFSLPIFRIFCISAIIAFIIAFLVAYSMAGKLTKPLISMAEATKSYAAGDFSPRIDIDTSDEMGQLAESFNKMAGELARLESSRRSFVANVSHELKTPMTSIGGFIDGILDGTIPPEEQNKYLTVVSSEVKRLSRMVVAMLNLSKIEAGQLDLKITDVNISDMLVSTMLMFEKDIDSKHIEIRGLDYIGQRYVRADKDMLSQVVYNLIDNAVKFTPENGHITVTVTQDEDFTQTSILNSGAGVEEDELAKIFERFYKVDKSRSFDKKSSGLGLYIVKSILELHGGKISASSKPNKYTEFVFKLPK